MNIPVELRYTQDHEWIKEEGGTATIGITDFAQGELGDIVFLEFPKVGDTFEAGAECGAIEAVKTVAQLFAPVSGTILEVNTALESDASLVNRDPYGEGWMIKIKMSDTSELDALLTGQAYSAQVS
jgi:glycine cleavage system H protein